MLDNCRGRQPRELFAIMAARKRSGLFKADEHLDPSQTAIDTHWLTYKPHRSTPELSNSFPVWCTNKHMMATQTCKKQKKQKKTKHERPKELAAVLIRFNYRQIKQRMLSALLGANCLPEPVLRPQSESGQIWGQSSSYLVSLTRAQDAPSALRLNACQCVFSAQS